MKLRAKKAQSVLEYTIILAAVIAAVIAGAVYFRGKVNASVNSAGDIMETATNNLETTLAP